jgi:hypothetical protein
MPIELRCILRLGGFKGAYDPSFTHRAFQTTRTACCAGRCVRSPLPPSLRTAHNHCAAAAIPSVITQGSIQLDLTKGAEFGPEINSMKVPCSVRRHLWTVRRPAVS